MPSAAPDAALLPVESDDSGPLSDQKQGDEDAEKSEKDREAVSLFRGHICG